MVAENRLGLVHIYYGSGVGKTTRAVGLATRAAGEGLAVDFVQFMKPGVSGEVAIFNQIKNIRYFCPGKHPFIMSAGPRDDHFRHADEALSRAEDVAERGGDLLICDEILDTLIFDLLQKQRIVALMTHCKAKRIECVLTGRWAPPELIEIADYVTEMKQKRHPYYRGFRARRGIEY